MKTKQELAKDYANINDDKNCNKALAYNKMDIEISFKAGYLAGFKAAQQQSQWMSVTEILPETKPPVNIIAVSDSGKRYRTMAYYIPAKTILADDFLDDDSHETCSEYDEENDVYWVKEGWFEYQTVSENHWKIEDKITHWLSIPELPKE